MATQGVKTESSPLNGPQRWWSLGWRYWVQYQGLWTVSVPHHLLTHSRAKKCYLQTRGRVFLQVSIYKVSRLGEKPMAQASRVCCKSSVKELFTELWVGRLKRSQWGMVTHGRAMTSPGLEGGPGVAHWATESWRHRCGCFWGDGQLTARRRLGKACSLCPPVIQPAGSQDRQHAPSSPPALWSTANASCWRNHTGARGQRGPPESCRAQSMVRRWATQGSSELSSHVPG